ncbi:MAG: calcium/sodium antiporter [Candidatus Magasanikbacteria bacterium]|nr:calcium/sodium antiporter [Candidatus Magasanikbacteria bacterium]
MILLWSLVFIVSMAVLVKGADWLIASAEKIGLSMGLSPFIVGVTIVGMGTSFPELISSLAATTRGVTDVVVANAIGSNIANILLVVGLSAVFSKKLNVTKSLIDIDLPLLAISAVLLMGVVWDQRVTFGESIILLCSYGIYALYTMNHSDHDEDEKITKKSARPKVTSKDFILLVLGVAALSLGAKYLVDALIQLSSLLNIGTGVIAITAVAVGTSLPELLVSIKAALQKKPEVALGNVFGSNVFNALVVVGIPGLIKTLEVDSQTYMIGLPTMAIATLLFVISGISQRIYRWEGGLYLMLYILFTAKLFQWF